MSAPLAAWNDGASKHAIFNFVERITATNGSDFIPVPERIAVFDNDGTLWCEQPMQVQLFFAFDRLTKQAKKDPSLRDRQPFKAFLEKDLATIASLGKQGAFEFAFSTHAGMTADQFDAIARAWLSTATHPEFGRLFKDNVYRPQIELLDYLRANGFRTFIVSGGGVDLIRSFAEEKYGITRNQVIGSSLKSRFEINDGRVDVIKTSELDSFDDRETKVENIYLHIGRRPVFAFGNSDGDLAMLRYTRTGSGPSLAMLLHHDDAEREFAYDREFRLSPLTEALAKASSYGLTVVSMRNDWNSVFNDRRRPLRNLAPQQP